MCKKGALGGKNALLEPMDTSNDPRESLLLGILTVSWLASWSITCYHHSLYDGLTRISLVEPLVDQGDGRLVKRSSVCTASHDT
jgi:hypothetical protein